MCNNNRQIPLPRDVRDSILAVRETGRTNMFDTNSVQRIAYEMDLYELVDFLENKSNRTRYTSFIMNGDGED